MAFSTRIHLVPVKTAQLSQSVDSVFWWNVQELFEKYPYRQIESLAYLDYVVVLTPTEAIEWQSHFRDKFIQNQMSNAIPNWQQRVDQLSQLLENQRHDVRWVIVELYEWESGLGD